MKLSEALQECTLALLRRIATNHSIPVGDDLIRAELCALVSERFSEDGYIEAYISHLPTEEKRLLVYLAAHGWQGKAFLLARQFARRSADVSDPSPCLSLLQKGLLYRTFGLIDSWRGELYL